MIDTQWVKQQLQIEAVSQRANASLIYAYWTLRGAADAAALEAGLLDRTATYRESLLRSGAMS